MCEIKVVTARDRKLLFNADGGKFYVGDTYEIELPEPVHIAEIAVHVQHHTDGLTLTGGCDSVASPNGACPDW